MPNWKEADTSYADVYRGLDIVATPELYRIGKGQQGVLIVPWSLDNVIPLWRFRTPDVARESSDAIYALFEKCLREQFFPGCDLAKKALHMGFTRSMRYWNHSSGQKYDEVMNVLPNDHADYDKYLSSRIFLESWRQARTNPEYLRLKSEHKLVERRLANN